MGLMTTVLLPRVFGTEPVEVGQCPRESFSDPLRPEGADVPEFLAVNSNHIRKARACGCIRVEGVRARQCECLDTCLPVRITVGSVWGISDRHPYLDFPSGGSELHRILRRRRRIRLGVEAVYCFYQLVPSRREIVLCLGRRRRGGCQCKGGGAQQDQISSSFGAT